jgi:hypothetical protein
MHPAAHRRAAERLVLTTFSSEVLDAMGGRENFFRRNSFANFA